MTTFVRYRSLNKPSGSDGTTTDVGGVMRIRDFAKDGVFVSTIWGFQTADPTLQAFTDEGPAGKFNMVFTPDRVRGRHPAKVAANDDTLIGGAARWCIQRSV